MDVAYLLFLPLAILLVLMTYVFLQNRHRRPNHVFALYMLDLSKPRGGGVDGDADGVDDLAIWTEALLSGRPVKRETLEKAFVPYKIKDGQNTKYGYGWCISDYEGHRLIEHSGGIHGFLSHAMFFPEDGVFIALLANSTVMEMQPEPFAFKAGCLALGIAFKEPVAIDLPEKDTEPLKVPQMS